MKTARAVAALSPRILVVKDQRQYSESDNREHGKAALYPQELSVKGHEFCEVFFPAKSGRHLEACCPN
jgi:hypothetical protein